MLITLLYISGTTRNILELATHSKEKNYTFATPVIVIIMNVQSLIIEISVSAVIIFLPCMLKM